MCVAVADAEGVADIMVAIAMEGRQIQNIIRRRRRSSSRECDEADFNGGIQ